MILKEEVFARLPRRLEEERPPNLRPLPGAVADVQQLDLSPRTFPSKFVGLFLFMPLLAAIPWDQLLHEAGFPGSRMVPAGAAIRSLLALKLFGSARHSHVMSYVLDEGLALFAGLNVIPKRSFLTEYSCRVDPRCYPTLMRLWFEALSTLGLSRGDSCDHAEWRPLSCGNRSCPRCQNHEASEWIDRQQAKLLPVLYFMVTFTLPYELRSLTWFHQKVVYSLLFIFVSSTLKDFGLNPQNLGAEIGMTMVLHTHNRKPDFHPHWHVVVPGGGVDKRRRQWKKKKGKYLFNQGADQ